METKWKPISKDELTDLIESGVDQMSSAQKRFWEAIRVSPEKWRLHPEGKRGGGFWVVGLIGNTVIWYNDIEGGFNRSPFSKYGRIDEYWCNQDELQWTIQYVLGDFAEE